MKRILLALALTLLGFSLPGCGGGGTRIDTPPVDPNDTATVGTSTAAPTGKKPNKGGGNLMGPAESAAKQ